MLKRMRSITAAAKIQSFFISSSTSAFWRSSAALRSFVSIISQILVSRSSVLLKSLFARNLSGCSARCLLSSRRFALLRACFSASSITGVVSGFELEAFMHRKDASRLQRITFSYIQPKSTTESYTLKTGRSCCHRNCRAMRDTCTESLYLILSQHSE